MHALDAFKQGKVAVLIATDVAARGLDIDSLPMVINYEIPHAAEDYVHRIGRTGRAGASGTAISLVAPEEERYLADIEKLIKTEIKKERAAVPEHAARTPQRAPRPERNEQRSHEYHAPAPKKPAHDSWFDKPYVPNISTPVPEKKKEEPALGKPKAQIPALFMRRSG
jgi:superfamily II DNA/RNA helicase